MEKYEKLGEIGKGSFGSVFKIKRKADGKILVWKELDYGRMQEKEKQQVVHEVNALSKLSHPNIVKYYDKIILKQQKRIYIVMEYCENGDMAQLIKKCKAEKDFVAEDVIWKIFMQIILALKECHDRPDGKILHRDLKPGNVFFDVGNNVKLGDFGLCRMLSAESQYAHTNVGTPYYMSPEQINESNYNEKTDIWSTGCILYEMVALHPPFTATNHLALARKIIGSKIERIPERYSEDLQNVIQWMLSKEPEKRPSVQDLMNIPKIQLRLNERKMREEYNQLKKRELDVKTHYDQIKEREKKCEQREAELAAREQKVRNLKLKLNKAANHGTYSSIQMLNSSGNSSNKNNNPLINSSIEQKEFKNILMNVNSSEKLQKNQNINQNSKHHSSIDDSSHQNYSYKSHPSASNQRNNNNQNHSMSSKPMKTVAHRTNNNNSNSNLIPSQGSMNQMMINNSMLKQSSESGFKNNESIAQIVDHNSNLVSNQQQNYNLQSQRQFDEMLQKVKIQQSQLAQVDQSLHSLNQLNCVNNNTDNPTDVLNDFDHSPQDQTRPINGQITMQKMNNVQPNTIDSNQSEISLLNSQQYNQQQQLQMMAAPQQTPPLSRKLSNIDTNRGAAAACANSGQNFNHRSGSITDLQNGGVTGATSLLEKFKLENKHKQMTLKAKVDNLIAMQSPSEGKLMNTGSMNTVQNSQNMLKISASSSRKQLAPNTSSSANLNRVASGSSISKNNNQSSLAERLAQKDQSMTGVASLQGFSPSGQNMNSGMKQANLSLTRQASATQAFNLHEKIKMQQLLSQKKQLMGSSNNSVSSGTGRAQQIVDQTSKELFMVSKRSASGCQ